MITGFNTDVEHQGEMFDVQTEDKGRERPLVETLVYCGGEIVASRQTSYADIVSSAGFSDDVLLTRMEAQHQTMIREIVNGNYDAGGAKPFGHNIITNRSLDEVVLEFLLRNVSVEEIRLELIDQQELLEGTRPTLRMKVFERGSERPICGAEVLVRLLSQRAAPRELFNAISDEEGFVEASFDLPELPGIASAILCRAEAAGKTAELRQRVQKAAAG